jgi:predicted Zn-dependent protease
MKTAMHVLSLASVLALSACSTVAPQPAPGVTPAVQPQNVASNDADDKLTGSRIPGKRTDRMLKSVGSQDYKDAKDSQPRPLNSQ